MTQIVTLHSNVHKDLHLIPERVEAQGAYERMVPVVLQEFLKLIVQYPIVLTKNIDTGQFNCVALLGFEKKENLFWNGARWEGVYTPLNITRQPFFLGREEQDQEAHLVCIDADSECLSTNSGKRLFDEQGQATDFLTGIKHTLAGLADGEQKTRDFIGTLAEFQLLVPLALEITLADSSKREVSGLYSIDEERLAQLGDKEIKTLFELGYLKFIYLMIGSLSHLYTLIERKNQRLNSAS